MQVIANGFGQLVVARRPDYPTAAYNYAPCSFCLTFCHKRTLCIHMKRCRLRKPKSKISKKCFDDGLMMLEQYIPKADALEQRLEAILEGMRETSVNEGKISKFHDTVL